MKAGKEKKGIKSFHYLYPIGSGALQTSFGIGDPLLVAFLTKTIDGRDELRSTVAGYWVFINGFLLASLVFSSGIPERSLSCGLILLPAVLLGTAGRQYSAQESEPRDILTISAHHTYCFICFNSSLELSEFNLRIKI